MVYIYILFLLALDLTTKHLAVIYQAPRLHFNKNFVMGLSFEPYLGPGLNNVIKLGFPVLIFPVMVYAVVKSIPHKIYQNLVLSFFCAGAIGNYIGRFSDRGVVDFLPTPGMWSYTNNFADYYGWIAMSTWFIYIYHYEIKTEVVSN